MVILLDVSSQLFNFVQALRGRVRKEMNPQDSFLLMKWNTMNVLTGEQANLFNGTSSGQELKRKLQRKTIDICQL